MMISTRAKTKWDKSRTSYLFDFLSICIKYEVTSSDRWKRRMIWDELEKAFPHETNFTARVKEGSISEKLSNRDINKDLILQNRGSDVET